MLVTIGNAHACAHAKRLDTRARSHARTHARTHARAICVRKTHGNVHTLAHKDKPAERLRAGKSAEGVGMQGG